MKLGSLFDGSGTAPLAAVMCGIEPVWASEIEPYPIKVTKARFPNMLHLGDITKINGAEVEPVDIICGGSPCQDLSVAGKQKGLQDGERSHLFFEMTRIIKQMREATDGKYPRYIIWENVPGAFSSNKGRDFHAVLQAFAEIADPDVYVPEPESKADRLVWKYAGEIMGDGWTVAWRTVDAQYWGVPQRRRRIYLVADLTGECAGEILFERTGVSGHSEPSGTQGKETAADAGGSIEGSGGSTVVLMDAYQHHGWRVGETCGTLTAGQNNTIRGDTPLCVYDITGVTSNSMKSPTPDSCFKQRDIARTLDTFVGSPECNQGGNVVVETTELGTYQNTGAGWWNESPTAATLSTPCGGDSVMANVITQVVYPGVGITSKQNQSNPKSGEPCHTLSTDSRNHLVKECYPDITGSLCANSHPGSYTGQDAFNDMLPVVPSNKPNRKYIVRRLTPLECCRLQGFPDWWEDGVEGSDSARYKMWGNGMALPNMLHVMKGIAMGRGREGGMR